MSQHLKQKPQQIQMGGGTNNRWVRDHENVPLAKVLNFKAFEVSRKTQQIGVFQW
jgi:hypothetical protein